MVNFEADTIVQVSPRQTITYIYLQRSEELQLAWKNYHIQKFRNRNTVVAVAEIRGALFCLFDRLRPSLNKSLNEELFKKLETKVISEDIDILKGATEDLEEYLYIKNITKIDSTKKFDSLRVEQENEAFGL